jgi:hypothetical protein
VVEVEDEVEKELVPIIMEELGGVVKEVEEGVGVPKDVLEEEGFKPMIEDYAKSVAAREREAKEVEGGGRRGGEGEIRVYLSGKTSFDIDLDEIAEVRCSSRFLNLLRDLGYSCGVVKPRVEVKYALSSLLEVEACTPSAVIDCRYRGFTAVTYSVFKVESRKRRVYVVRRVYEDERPFDELHDSISFIEGKKLVGVVRRATNMITFELMDVCHLMKMSAEEFRDACERAVEAVSYVLVEDLISREVSGALLK